MSAIMPAQLEAPDRPPDCSLSFFSFFAYLTDSSTRLQCPRIRRRRVTGRSSEDMATVTPSPIRHMSAAGHLHVFPRDRGRSKAWQPHLVPRLDLRFEARLVGVDEKQQALVAARRFGLREDHATSRELPIEIHIFAPLITHPESLRLARVR